MDWFQKIEAAESLPLDAPELEILFNDPEYRVRYILVKRLPGEHPAMAGFASDESSYLRSLAAQKLPVESPAFDKLCKDEDPHVRLICAYRVPLDSPLIPEFMEDWHIRANARNDILQRALIARHPVREMFPRSEIKELYDCLKQYWHSFLPQQKEAWQTIFRELGFGG